MLGQRTSLDTTLPALGLSGRPHHYHYDPLYQLTQDGVPCRGTFQRRFPSGPMTRIGNRHGCMGAATT